MARYASNDQPTPNLNADLLDGYHASEIIALIEGNHLLTEAGAPLLTENGMYLKIQS